MNFANQDSQPSDLNSESIMETSMAIIYEMLIEPMEENLDNSDLQTISLIGVAFKIMSEKAHAYEKLMGEVPEENEEENQNNFSRN